MQPSEGGLGPPCSACTQWPDAKMEPCLQVMTLGLKTVRELCARTPLVMTPDLLQARASVIPCHHARHGMHAMGAAASLCRHPVDASQMNRGMHFRPSCRLASV